MFLSISVKHRFSPFFLIFSWISFFFFLLFSLRFLEKSYIIDFTIWNNYLNFFFENFLKERTIKITILNIQERWIIFMIIILFEIFEKPKNRIFRRRIQNTNKSQTSWKILSRLKTHFVIHVCIERINPNVENKKKEITNEIKLKIIST